MMGIGKQTYVDKDALLQEGKLFCRVFLAYLWGHPDYRGWWGKEALACELIEEGKRSTAVTREVLSHSDLTALLYNRTNKNPYWLNYALMQVALRRGFVPTHLADWVAVCRTVANELVLPTLEGIEGRIATKYGLTLPMDMRQEVEARLCL
ncbi:hypothetical protein HBJ00_14205 [Aeromonas veronii]|jgi:hypothetical protein|nr:MULTISPECIES: hypothetical protein [Aeromonas]EKP0313588.1 hypothetical protein [Aeromonas veronii]NJI19825.1 hypothetical protein [Aeromonas veronii]